MARILITTDHRGRHVALYTQAGARPGEVVCHLSRCLATGDWVTDRTGRARFEHPWDAVAAAEAA